jgi:hypothetical protein
MVYSILVQNGIGHDLLLLLVLLVGVCLVAKTTYQPSCIICELTILN